MHFHTLAALLLSAGSVVQATFNLVHPRAMGFNNDKQSEALCGGFNVTKELYFRDWPTGGHDIKITDINDSHSLFMFNVALLDDDNNFVQLYPDVSSQKKGTLCFKKIKGMNHPDWIGKKAIFQLKQHAGNGKFNYACAPVRFVEGDPDPNVCTGEGAPTQTPGADTLTTSEG
ncbi:hypothetical protein F5Y15DRAFT_15567 [Xylariaceae sp. FL0016]|nr:hypothetical protein F5Y15DRAFT_15567 [Xylariaceae sp. FL0016]